MRASHLQVRAYVRSVAVTILVSLFGIGWIRPSVAVSAYPVTEALIVSEAVTCALLGQPGAVWKPVEPQPDPVPPDDEGTGGCDPNSDPCCNDPDPCCGSSDPCCGIDCDDGNACTDDWCENGDCVHAALDCNDGNPCTDDSCDPASGCANSLEDCADGNPCTLDSCNPATGDCEHDDIGTPDDLDCDGIPNGEDSDVDGDGIPNEEDDDVDGDGIPNGEDDDIDGDGIPNASDPDADGDGLSNGEDDDIDGDGMANDQDDDADGDGVPNGQDGDDDGDGIGDDDDDSPGGCTLTYFSGLCCGYHFWPGSFTIGFPVPDDWVYFVKVNRDDTNQNGVIDMDEPGPEPFGDLLPITIGRLWTWTFDWDTYDWVTTAVGSTTLTAISGEQRIRA